MRLPPIELQGVTRIQSSVAIERIERAVSSAGGSILGYQTFSDISLFLRLQIPPSRLPLLHTALREAGLHLTPEIGEVLRQLPTPGTAILDVPATLRVSFLHSEPDWSTPLPTLSA